MEQNSYIMHIYMYIYAHVYRERVNQNVILIVTTFFFNPSIVKVHPSAPWVLDAFSQLPQQKKNVPFGKKNIFL